MNELIRLNNQLCQTLLLLKELLDEYRKVCDLHVMKPERNKVYLKVQALLSGEKQ